MNRFVDRSIVLVTRDYGEADKIVTLFTERHGRVLAFAASARKSKRRFGGGLEPGTIVAAHLVEKNSEMFRLDKVDVERSLHHISGDLALISRMLYCLELCREIVRDHEPHGDLFEALIDYLQRLDAGQAGPTSLIAFELKALECAGFRPRFNACSLCEGAIDDDPSFDTAHGGVVCQRCSHRVPQNFRVSKTLIDAFVKLQEGARVPWGPEQRGQGRALLDRFIAYQLGRKLKSAEFMDQLGVD